MKRGQAATEYMIILAVVIIIALIVVGVMGGIPGIGSGAKTKASAAYWSQADIAIVAYSVTSASPQTMTLKLRNNLRSTITITNVSYAISPSSSAIRELTNTTYVTAPGQTITITVTSTTSSGITSICTTTSVGNSWSTPLSIKYTDQETGATYYFTGDGNKLEGSCAS